MSERQKPKLLIVGNLAKDIIFGTEEFGGCAANIAIAAKNLGLDVGIMSVLGRDSFSKKYLDYLHALKINTEMISQDIDTIPTCEVNSSENKISCSQWTDNGCHEAMDKLPVSKNLNQYNLIHLVSSPPTLSLRFAKKFNSLSYEPGPLLIENPKYFDSRVAKRSKLLFLNEEEYTALIKNNQVNFPINCRHYPNLDAAIVTMGKNGSRIYSQEKILNIPPQKISALVDSIGAGDNYKAGFIFGFLSRMSLQNSAQIGSELGALCVQQKGGILPKNKVTSIINKYILP